MDENVIYSRIRDLRKFYSVKELIKSTLTDFLFFIFPTLLTVTILVNLILLMINNFLYIMILIYVILVAINFMSKKMFITTLKNYNNVENLDYDHIKGTLLVITNLALLAIVYVITFYII